MTDNKKTTRPSGISIEKPTHDGPKQGPPVDVNSNITPITRKEIQQVDASQWPKLTAAQLTDQLSILEKRLQYAQQIGHQDMMTQIRRGINQLHALINQKSSS